jgi:surface carbohydrate biosynthesis protein
MKFLARSVYFSFPKYADFIIFDETNSNIISQVIPETYSSSIFRTRPVHLIINFEVIFYFLIYLKDLRIFKKFTSNKSFIRNILWQLLCIYIKSYIYTVKPKAVITSIDNCTKFAWLSENISEIPFIAVQNGFRLSYDVDSKSIYHCQHLFCFGQFEVEKFPQRNWTVNNFYPVGSLNASLNFEKEDKSVQNKYDFLIVSCWRGNIGYTKDVQDSMEAMRLFDEDFSTYLNKRNLRVGVIMRSERDSDQWFIPEIGMNEEEYYKSIYNDQVDIIDTNFTERNIYKEILRSKIIISGFSTTVLLEALGAKKKILYCNYTSKDKYHLDFDKSIVFVKDKDNSLAINLDKLLEIKESDYEKRYSKLLTYYQSFKSEISTRDIIKDKINQVIKSNEA